MTTNLAVVFAVSLWAAGGQTAARTASSIGGDVPWAIGPAVSVVWIGADGPKPDACEISATRWHCAPADAPGIVAVFGATGVALSSATLNGAASAVIRRWGTALVLVPGTAAAGTLHEIRLSAARPDRSVHRPKTVRFLKTSQPNVDVVPVSSTVFFVAGDDVDPDAFLEVEGPEVATTRVPMAAIAGAADHRVDVLLDAPSTLTGRVTTASGEDVEDAAITLAAAMTWHPSNGDASTTSGRRDEKTLEYPTIDAAETRSGPGGLFAFEHLGAGPFLVSATHRTLGRQTAVVRSVSEPLVVRLAPLPIATGRVVRHQLPVGGAVVRFVPDVPAFTESTDPGQLAAEPAVSGADGRFSIALPPNTSGSLVATAPEGGTIRVKIQKPAENLEMTLGDLVLPDPIRLTVRLLDLAACEMQAAGPLGSLGVATVRANRAANTYLFELPEPGEWVLNASCGDCTPSLQPQIVAVGSGPSDTPLVVDVRIVR